MHPNERAFVSPCECRSGSTPAWGDTILPVTWCRPVIQCGYAVGWLPESREQRVVGRRPHDSNRHVTRDTKRVSSQDPTAPIASQPRLQNSPWLSRLRLVRRRFSAGFQAFDTKAQSFFENC